MSSEHRSRRGGAFLSLALIVAGAAGCGSSDKDEASASPAAAESPVAAPRPEARPAASREARPAARPAAIAGGEAVLETDAEERPPINSEALAVARELRDRGDLTSDQLDTLQAHLQRFGRVDEGEETDEDLRQLVEALAATGLTSHVEFTTEHPGAVIRYRLITNTEPDSAAELTNTIEDLAIGYYYVWSERQGHASSDTRRRFRIVVQEKRIELDEGQ